MCSSDLGTVALSFFVPGIDNIQGENLTAVHIIPWGERIFDWAVAENLKILGMSRKKLSIEEIFVSLTADEQDSTETRRKK